MQIVVINLATEPARWVAASRQFEQVGLQARRLVAIDGSRLGADDQAALYCEELNRRQYHKALGRGEIGCYASHLAAWRMLVQSGERTMAIFEDDIEIDADLPRVLDAVACGPGRALGPAATSSPIGACRA
jgi:glycosyl transferase family 25